jgi:hypothetical protein
VWGGTEHDSGDGRLVDFLDGVGQVVAVDRVLVLGVLVLDANPVGHAGVLLRWRTT